MFLPHPLLIPFCRLCLFLFLSLLVLPLYFSLHSLSLTLTLPLCLSPRIPFFSFLLFSLPFFLSLHLFLSLPPSHLSHFPRSGIISPFRRDSRFILIFFRLSPHRHPDHTFPLGLVSSAKVNHHSTCLYIPSDSRFIRYNKSSSTEKDKA